MKLRTCLLLALCALTILIYWPGLSGDFIFDDYANIVRNNPLHVSDLSVQSSKAILASGISGPLRRPISMATFALNYYLTGLDTFYFKLTNLVIHVLAGIAVFLLTTQLLGAYRETHQSRLGDSQIRVVTFAVTAAWLLHPLNLTGVLYVVQRMTSLSGLFVFGGMACYLAGRRRINSGKSGLALIFTALLVFTPLAALSKENGALLPVFMLAVEFALFGFKTPRPGQRNILFTIFGLSVAVPVLAAAIYTTMHPQWLLNGYDIRGFTPWQRLLTEARVLWFYIGLTIAPTAGQLGLFHDDFSLSQGMLQPYSTLFAVAGIVALLTAAFALRRRAPLASLGLLWFFVGQSLESTILPLELVYEHRNYVPMYGLLLPLFYYGLHPFALAQSVRVRHAVAALFIVLLATATTVRAGDWGNPALMAVVDAAHHPYSARSNHYAGQIYAALTLGSARPADQERYYKLALRYYDRSTKDTENDPSGLISKFLIESAYAGSVDEATVKALAYRLRHRPFANGATGQLLGIVKCEEQGRCKPPLSTMNRLFQAALDNPTLKGSVRVSVLTSEAEHLINRAGKYQDALTLLMRAVAVEPRALIPRLSFAEVLTAARQYDDAREQLRIARRLDRWGMYASMIADQTRALAEAEAQSKTDFEKRTPASTRPGPEQRPAGPAAGA